MLTKSLYEILGKTPSIKLGARVMAPSHKGDPYYVFLLLPIPDNVQTTEYREMRRDVLESYCLVTKYKFPDAEDIVGFATESGRGEYGSEDLIYLDVREWTEENQAHAESLHNEFGLLKTVNQYAGKEFEFPVHKTMKRKRRRSRKR